MHNHVHCICRKFKKTIEILQEDIESLENDKMAIERKLDQESKKTMLADTATTRRMRGASFGNAFGLQRKEERRGGEGAAGEQQEGAQPPVDGAASPLLLARVGWDFWSYLLCTTCTHNHVPTCMYTVGGLAHQGTQFLSGRKSKTQDKNSQGKIDRVRKVPSFIELQFCQLCSYFVVIFSFQAQLSGLPLLVVPKRLVHKGWRKTEEKEGEKEREGEGGVEINQTDQEKSVLKDTACLLEVCPFQNHSFV